MAINLKANKVNLFISSVLFVFWYHSPNFLDTPRIKRNQSRVGYKLIMHLVVVLLGGGRLKQAEPFPVKLKITGFRNVALCAYHRRYCSKCQISQNNAIA
jgi:hypothetical protein